MSMLLFIILDNIPKLFLIELIFIGPIIILLMLDKEILFKIINASSIPSQIFQTFSKTVFSADSNDVCLIHFVR